LMIASANAGHISVQDLSQWNVANPYNEPVYTAAGYDGLSPVEGDRLLVAESTGSYSRLAAYTALTSFVANAGDVLVIDYALDLSASGAGSYAAGTIGLRNINPGSLGAVLPLVDTVSKGFYSGWQELKITIPTTGSYQLQLFADAIPAGGPA